MAGKGGGKARPDRKDESNHNQLWGKITVKTKDGWKIKYRNEINLRTHVLHDLVQANKVTNFCVRKSKD